MRLPHSLPRIRLIATACTALALTLLGLAREPILDITMGNPHFDDEQKRLIAGTIGDTRIICAYMPNGQAVGSEKYEYKLRWLDALAIWVEE